MNIKLLNTILILSLGFLFLGCSANLNVPTQEKITNADYGAKPTQYKQLIERHMTRILKDPESAQFRNYSIPKKDWLSDYPSGFSLDYPIYFGWLVCVDINAKNSYGGYTGVKPYYFIFKGNKIVYAKEPGNNHFNNLHKIIGVPSHLRGNYPIQCKYE